MSNPKVFNINPTDMTDGSGRLYSVDTQEGERVGSTTHEPAARELRDALNEVLRLWQVKWGSDAAVS